MLNPLFPSDDPQKPDDDKSGLDPFRSIQRHGKTIEPLHDLSKSSVNPAADLIRDKLARLYPRETQEPSAKEEITEAKEAPKPISKHQRFMLDLSTSGKSLAEIQTAWHNYYLGLPDNEKHEVWQEFYENNAKSSRYQQAAAQQSVAVSPQTGEIGNVPIPKPEESTLPKAAIYPEPLEEKKKDAEKAAAEAEPKKETSPNLRTVADIKRQIAGKANARGKLTIKHHVQSLLFGLSIGLVVVVITLFSFFNEYFIAPFIQPSRDASATPIIIGTDSVAPSTTPQVIIPKINVEAPLNFSVPTVNEDDIENALEDGVVHYPTTVLPGQTGNTAFFGHSSNNILNPGHYKFVFTLLHELVPGDTFYLTYGDKVYAYQVFKKEIVSPNDTAVLDNVPNYTATATLITCDPPGTSINRLVVWGEQVSPAPSTDGTGTNTSSTAAADAQLPGNGPSLWSRMVSAIESWF